MPKFLGIRLYAAGKISHNCWRHTIAPLRGAFANGEVDHPEKYEWPKIPIHSLPGAVYVGPYFLSDDHGCYHDTPHSHGVAAGGRACGEAYAGLSRADTAARCLAAIEDSTHVFAWIDEPTAYGTLVEIGYARAMQKSVSIYFKEGEELGDLWFSAQISSSSSKASSATEAWKDFCLRLVQPTD